MYFDQEIPFAMRHFPVLFDLIFFLVLGVFVFVIASAIIRFLRNQASPEMVEEATVVTKRMETRSSGSMAMHYGSGHHHGTHHHTYTRYFITFEFADGRRQEFQVTNSDYGLIAEHDKGRLSYRGTRFNGFSRY